MLFTFLIITLVLSWSSTIGSSPTSETTRALESFSEIPDDCQDYSNSVNYGQTAVITAATASDRYDIRKRPQTSPVVTGPYAGRTATNDPDDVTVEIKVVSVKNVDQLSQSMTLSLFEITKWTDYRLTFDTSESASAQCVVGAGTPANPFIALEDYAYSGADALIWTPDVYIVNQVAATEDQHLTFVYSSGKIEHQEQKTVSTSCTMDFARFPFDVQSCDFKVSTFAQSSNEVTLSGGTATGDLLDISTLLTNEQVGFYYLKSATTTSSYESESRKIIVGTLTFEREPSSFWEGVFLPDLLLHIAISMSFWVSASAAPARVSICIIAALTFRIMMSGLYAQLPPVVYSVWVLDFMMSSQIFAVMALVQYGAVQYHLANEAAATKTAKALVQSTITKRLASGELKAKDIFELARQTKTEFDEVVAATDWGRIRFDGVFPKLRRCGQKCSCCSVSGKKMSTKKVSPNSPSRRELSAGVGTLEAGGDDGEARSGGELSPMFKLSTSSVSFQEVIVPISPTKNQERPLFSTTEATAKPEKTTPKMGIRDAEILTYVEEIFEKFDDNLDGTLTARELQLALRFFGAYHSKMQTCELLQAFRESQGSSLKEEPKLDIMSFLCILTEHEKFDPLERADKELWYDRPSTALDKFTRFAYPAMYALRTAYFFAIIRWTSSY
jgi:hypothetical protein